MRTFVRIKKLQRPRCDSVSPSQVSHEICHLVVRQRRVTAAGKFARRLKAERLQVAPICRIAVHVDGVLVPQDDASAIEHAADRRIDLARDLGLGAPDWAQNGSDVERW